MLAVIGAGVAALLSPWPDALLPLVAAGELTYLAGMVSHPKFRTAIDANECFKTKATAIVAVPNNGEGAPMLEVGTGDQLVRRRDLAAQMIEVPVGGVLRGVHGPRR